MSDHDVEVTAVQSTSRRNADRRTPRFSWNLAYEETFFRSLCESVQLGYKENHSFKAGAWERAATALGERHGAYPEKSHLINKADNARKKFRMWRGLREDPEFLYNPTSRMVTASEDAWRRHFDREPLSKALRGRPFDHEEYMEILFPDVVGSGGAPKRIMKPRRRNPDGTLVPRQGNADTSMDTSSTLLYTQSPSQASLQQLQPLQQPTPQLPTTSAAATQPMRRQSATAVVPRPSIAPQSIALTPPDETTPNTQSRKRPHPDPASTNPEKRRGRPSRFAPSFYNNHSSSGTPITPPTTTGGVSSGPSQNVQTFLASSGVIETSILTLAEALRSRTPPKWPEQALEIFFREFADEEADLQLKIAEKALTDDNKALVFVKMTPTLRRHWVSRLRDIHMRGIGGGLS
ncbi:Myb/SANT-like DNA-binding domain-containing protein [Xylariaceae sp. FL0255]|nr:Myb/SANT-like DNA-binding domain-containing protein [Xylariaceae sp. FL0255]